MASNQHSEPVNPPVTHGRQEGGRPTVDLPHSERDLRVPKITRTWERVAKVLPSSDPTNPDDPSVNLDTLAAIANAKWWRAHDLEEQYKASQDALYVLLGSYTELVASGDCGFWDAEAEPAVIAARAALSSPASAFISDAAETSETSIPAKRPT